MSLKRGVMGVRVRDRKYRDHTRRGERRLGKICQKRVMGVRVRDRSVGMSRLKWTTTPPVRKRES